MVALSCTRVAITPGILSPAGLLSTQAFPPQGLLLLFGVHPHSSSFDRVLCRQLRADESKTNPDTPGVVKDGVCLDQTRLQLAMNFRGHCKQDRAPQNPPLTPARAALSAAALRSSFQSVLDCVSQLPRCPEIAAKCFTLVIALERVGVPGPAGAGHALLRAPACLSVRWRTAVALTVFLIVHHKATHDFAVNLELL